MKPVLFLFFCFKAEVFSIAYNEELDVFERMEKMMARAEKIFIDEETGSVDGNIGVETALVIPEFRPIIQAFFADFIKAIKHLYLSEFEEPKANSYLCQDKAYTSLKKHLSLCFHVFRNYQT